MPVHTDYTFTSLIGSEKGAVSDFMYELTLLWVSARRECQFTSERNVGRRKFMQPYMTYLHIARFPLKPNQCGVPVLAALMTLNIFILHVELSARYAQVRRWRRTCTKRASPECRCMLGVVCCALLCCAHFLRIRP